MNSTSEVPHASAVRDQLARLCQYYRFRDAPSLKRLLHFLVEQWLLDTKTKLTERSIGNHFARENPGGSEKLKLDPHTGTYRYPITKANLHHVRERLNTYYSDPVNSLAPVIIKLAKGSYMPIIQFNPSRSAIPDFDEPSRRLILRSKTALDMRTYTGALRATHYLFDLLKNDSKHHLKWANIAFIPFAIAPLEFSLAHRMMPHAERFIDLARAESFNPWECVFTEGCIKAARDHEWLAALNRFNSVKELSQSESLYYWWHTALLAATGDIEESINILDAAVRHFSRTNLATRTDLAMLQIMAGRYSDAEENLYSSMDFASPANPLLAGTLAILYEAQDRGAEALNATRPWFEKAKNMPDPSHLDTDELSRIDITNLLGGILGLLCGRARDTERANTICADLLRKKAQYQAQSSFEVAIAMIGVGDYTEAIQSLRKAAFEEYEPFAMWFHIFPPLRHLRQEEAFLNLLSDLNLPL